MADDLKRVGLKFTAEGVEDFKGALKSISAATKENYSELKLAQSQYDKNTSSTQKLTDRQKYLQKQTELYTDKVNVLQQQLDEEKSKEDASSDAIAKKETELNKAQAKLNGYKSSLEDVNKALSTHASQIQDWGSKLTDVGGKIEGVGTAMTKGITVPVAAVATASVFAWKEVDDAMDTVTQKTGASGAALEDMQNRAKEIAETIPVSFADAGTAIGEVNTRFGVTGDTLSKLSTQFLEFAQLNNTDVNSSIDSVQKTLSAFGLSANDAGAMLDTLNAVGQQTGIDMGTLTSTLVANGASFREMGMSASDAAYLVGNLEKSGINTNDVMTGLKKAMAEAASTGESMGDVLSTAFSSSANATEIFGTKAGPGLYNAMQSGIISLDMFTAGTTDLNDAVGSVSDTFDATQDPLDKTTTMLNKLKDLGSELVDTAAPLITSVLDSMTTVVTNLKNGWDALSPGMQTAIEKFVGFAATLGPVIVAIGKVSSGVGGLATKFADALAKAGSFGGALTSLAGGPVTLIVAGIAAIVTAIIYLWNSSESFRNFWITVWDAIKNAVSTVFTAISGFWTTYLQPVFTAIGTFIQTVLLPIFQVVFMTIGEVVQTAFELIADVWQNVLQPVFQAIWDFLSGVLGPIFQTVFDAIETVVETVFNAIKKVWDSVLKPVFDAIKEFITGPLASAFKTAFDAIKTVVETVFNAIKKVWDSVLKPVFEAIKSLITGPLASAFSTVFNGIKSVVSTAFSGIKTVWNNVLKPVFNAIKNAMQPIFDTASRVFGNIKRKIEDVFNGIKSFLSPVIDWLKGIFDFSWSLPKIKLPHFSVTGKFRLNPPRVPHFSVRWYAKAMDAGMILNSPTIFGASGSTLLGAGEAGPEVVVGRDSLANMIKESTQEAVSNTTAYGDVTINVYAAQGQNVKEIADEVKRKLINEMKREKAVTG